MKAKCTECRRNYEASEEQAKQIDRVCSICMRRLSGSFFLDTNQPRLSSQLVKNTSLLSLLE